MAAPDQSELSPLWFIPRTIEQPDRGGRRRQTLMPARRYNYAFRQMRTAVRLRVSDVEPSQRPFLHRPRFHHRLAERRTGHEIESGAGAHPHEVAVPLDEDVVGVARIAEIVVEAARLRRDEVADIARCLRVLDIV